MGGTITRNGIFAGLSTDQRLKLLNSLPALDPGAYAQAANQKKNKLQWDF